LTTQRPWKGENSKTYHSLSINFVFCFLEKLDYLEGEAYFPLLVISGFITQSSTISEMRGRLETLLIVAFLHLTSAQTVSYSGETSNDGKKNGRGEELMQDGARYVGLVPFALT
jgi:hypothetical protein